MKEELKKLGLTEGEARVYLALLKLRTTKVGPLVKKSKVSYSKIYDVLNRLLDKGLINYIQKEKIKHFQAVEPNRILDYLKEKQKQAENKIKLLNKILPDLKEYENQDIKEEASIYTGFKGLKTAYEMLLKDSTKKDPLLYFYVHDENTIKQADLFYKQEFHHFRKLKLKLKGITTESFKKSKYFKKPPAFIELKYVDFPLPGTIDIYRDRILITSWSEIPISYLIHSKEIADNYRKYFHEVWKQAR